MMIFMNEWKRIMRPIILLFIVVMSIFWYLTFMGNSNSYLDNDVGMPYAVAKEYVQRFGTTIDADEIKEIEKDYEAARSELDELIEQYMGEYGIHTMDEYEDYSEKYETIFGDKQSEDYYNAISEWGEEEYNRRAEINDKLESICFDNNAPVCDAMFKAQTIGFYVEEYDFLLEERKAYREGNEDWFFEDTTDQERKVLENRLSKDEISAVADFFGVLEMNFESCSDSWSLLIFICCAIAIVPMLVKNRINRITALQYSTKQGRRILVKQLFAAVSVGLLISLILIFFFQIFYFWNGGKEFIHCPINLSTGSGLYWFDFTLLGYMVCLWTTTVFLVVCESVFLFWISYFGKNYVTAIAVSVPVIAFLHSIWGSLNGFLRVSCEYPRFLHPFVIGVVVVITIVVSVIFMHKAKKADCFV